VLFLLQTRCFLMTPNSMAATSYTSVLWLRSFLASPMSYLSLTFQMKETCSIYSAQMYDTMKHSSLSRGQC
jgi:hypothetical protein